MTVGRGPSALIVLVVGIAIGAALTWAWLVRPGFTPVPTVAGAIPRPAICFTPGGACTEAIVAAIGEARREVLVQAYSFTSPPIARALEDARRRGAQVRVIVDDSQLRERFSQADEVRRAGAEVWVDDPTGIAHNKVMVVDGELVVTGSFNFSRSAQERNTENVVILRDRALAALYAENWERRRAVSVPFDQAVRDAQPPAANDNERDTRKRRDARFGLF